MPTEYAPPAIREAFDYLAAQAPELRLQLSGVLGDRAHTYGYHRARAVLPADDYSVQLPADRAGDAWAASALDVKPATAAGMVAMTRRLIAAVERRDPRLYALREFFGTVNGSSVTGRDVASGRAVTADDSHLWHLHLSGLRRYANDAAAWKAVADVIAGNPLEEEFTMDAEAKAAFDALNKRLDQLPPEVWGWDHLKIGNDPNNPTWAPGSAVAWQTNVMFGIRDSVAKLTSQLDELRGKVDALAPATSSTTRSTTSSSKPAAGK